MVKSRSYRDFRPLILCSCWLMQSHENINRTLWEQRVAGSNPVSPTTKPAEKRHFQKALGYLVGGLSELCIRRVYREGARHYSNGPRKTLRLMAFRLWRETGQYGRGVITRLNRKRRKPLPVAGRVEAHLVPGHRLRLGRSSRSRYIPPACAPARNPARRRGNDA